MNALKDAGNESSAETIAAALVASRDCIGYLRLRAEAAERYSDCFLFSNAAMVCFFIAEQTAQAVAAWQGAPLLQSVTGVFFGLGFWALLRSMIHLLAARKAGAESRKVGLKVK